MGGLRPPPSIARSRRRDSMLEKRRNGRVSTKTSIEDEIAHLRGLDLKGLRSRWQSVFRRPPLDHLPRHLLFAIIAYRIQADRLGDLDHETKQVLDRTDAKSTERAIAYESLDIMLGRTPRPDLDSLQRKMISGGRAGYCLEQNMLFREGLRSLGYKLPACKAESCAAWPSTPRVRPYICCCR